MGDSETYLNQWEEAYKKGLLTFWILLILAQRKAYPYEMSALIAQASNYTLSVDENSIYRALRRLSEMNLVQSEFASSYSGPARRYFDLTEDGLILLNLFTERNILIFQTPEVINMIKNMSMKTSKLKERENENKKN